MQITPFMVMEILEKAQQLEARGKGVIHLEVGEPDFPTPPEVGEAAVKAIREGDTGYTHSQGKGEFREEIAAYYRSYYGVGVHPDQVIVTMGSSPAMLIILAALLQEGGEVIISDPCYACYANYIRFSRGVPRLVPVSEEGGFNYRVEEVRGHVGPRTRGIMLNSPANPTGSVTPRETLARLARLGVPLISDEVYHGLNYAGKDHTALEFTDQAFVINSFSKRYAMTGWRLGFLIAPPRYIRFLQVLQQNFFISVPPFIQEAGRAALAHGQPLVQEMVKTYDRRRRYLLQRLQDMGIATRVPPTGAFYALANLKKYSRDSCSLAFEILEKTGVALTPGVDFGPRGEGYLRISYSNSLENIKEGLDRLEVFLGEKGESS